MKHLLQVLIALTLLISPAIAQDDQAKQILRDSAAALQATPGFTAKVTLSGTGSEMILSTLPSMTARMTMGSHSEVGKVLHLIGELNPRKGAEPESFDALYANDRFIWIDHKKQALNIRPPSVSIRQRPTFYSYLLLTELVSPTPFESELTKAESFELESQQSIAGTNCDVILINRAKPDGSRRSGAGSHSQERWFIGVDDHLPRRVEQITDAGMIKATLIMELTSLNIASQSDSELYPQAPETYTISDTTRKSPEPKIPDIEQPFTKPTTNNTPPSPPTPTNPSAPNYTFTDTSGSEITRSSQTGRVTVLYFGGSWCIPCKDLTPLVSTLTNELTDQADIFAIAVRESDPDAVIDDHQSNNYTHRLSVKSPSNLSSLFRVRVYPTIVVIDQEARIIYQAHLTKDLDAESLIDKTKSTITKALAQTP